MGEQGDTGRHNDGPELQSIELIQEQWIPMVEQLFSRTTSATGEQLERVLR